MSERNIKLILFPTNCVRCTYTYYSVWRLNVMAMGSIDSFMYKSEILLNYIKVIINLLLK